MYNLRIVTKQNKLVLRQIKNALNIQARAKRGLKGEKGDPGEPATNLVTSVNGKQGDVVLDASDVGADIAGSAAQALSDANDYTDTQIDNVNLDLSNKVSKSGDTMSGKLTIDAPTIGKQLEIVSSNAGGLNNYDSTGRIQLHSYQRAQVNNSGNTNIQQAHYGEVLRIDLEHQQAKGVIAIRENYLGAPEGPRTVAWMVAHGEANDSTPQNPVWHNHFSIELPDENGALQTSLEFPFAPFNQPNGFGMPTADRYVRSVVPLLAASDLVVEQDNATNKNIFFSSKRYKDNTGRRFGIQLDNTAESGTNSGSNFRINRYNDSGTFVDSVMYIRRSDKQVGINTVSPTSQFDVNGNIRTTSMSMGNAAPQGGAALYIERNISGVGFLFRNTAAAGHVAANLVSQSQTAGSRAFQVGLQSDSINRYSLEASGLMEWGAGGNTGRDTNLYRSGANELKTDDKFIAALGVDSGGQAGTNFADPTSAQDAATKNYVDTAVSGVPIGNYVLKSGDTMTGTLTGQSLEPSANLTYNLGTTNYYSAARISRVNLNATAYIDGATAGRLDITGTMVASASINAGASITSAANMTVAIVRNNNFSDGVTVSKRGTTGDATAALTSGSEVGYHQFYGWDGTQQKRLAYVIVYADGNTTPTTGGGTYSIVLRNPSTNAENTLLRLNGSGTMSYFDGLNVNIGTGTGTKIGTATTQKLSFWNATPVVQPTAIADANGTLGDINTKLNAALAALRSVGLIAT